MIIPQINVPTKVNDMSGLFQTRGKTLQRVRVMRHRGLAIPAVLFVPASLVSQCGPDVVGLPVTDSSGIENHEKGPLFRGLVILLVHPGELEEGDFDAVVVLGHISSV